MSFLGTEEQLLQRFQVIESNLLVIFKTESGFWELPFKPDCTSLQIQGTFAQLKLLTLNGILVEFKIIMEFVRKRKRWLAFVLFAKKMWGAVNKWEDGGDWPLSSYDELLHQSLQSLEHLQPLLYLSPLFRKKIFLKIAWLQNQIINQFVFGNL